MKIVKWDKEKQFVERRYLEYPRTCSDHYKSSLECPLCSSKIEVTILEKFVLGDLSTSIHFDTPICNCGYDFEIRFIIKNNVFYAGLI